MQMSKFTHKTERYFGSKVNIHTVSWKGQEDVDTKEVKKWCKKNPTDYLLFSSNTFEKIGGYWPKLFLGSS